MDSNGVGKPIHARGLNVAVREARKHKQWSKAHMGRELGVPIATIWRIEHGKKMLHATAWMIVVRLLEWQLPEDQLARLSQLKERLMQ